MLYKPQPAIAASAAALRWYSINFGIQFGFDFIHNRSMWYAHLFVVCSAMLAVYISIDLQKHIALSCVKFPGEPIGMPKSIE